MIKSSKQCSGNTYIMTHTTQLYNTHTTLCTHTYHIMHTHIPHYAKTYHIMHTHIPHYAHITDITNHLDTKDFDTQQS